MSSKTVLIVEDDAMTAALLEQIAHDAGYQTLLAHDGITAVELYQQNLPQVVLLDLNLPQLHGYSFATLVRNFSDHRPKIIIVTGSPDAYEDHLQAITDGCVTKPINRQLLLDLLNE